MTSSVEIGDAETMQHIGNHSFGINWGSLTWVDFFNGHWWATFANYDVPYGPNKTPYGYKAATQMVKFTADFRYLESWVLPKAILDKFESMSNSGESWGPDGHRYLSGRDLADFCKMRLPKAGSVLELVEVIAMNIRGRGIAWDRSNRGVIESWPRGAVGSAGLAGWPTDGSARPKKDEGRHLTFLRSRYEITDTSLSISLRLLMPFRNVSAQFIL